ncbi:MAG: SH3 domain-containing protein [Microcoleaceae cyanobacterium]
MQQQFKRYQSIFGLIIGTVLLGGQGSVFANPMRNNQQLAQNNSNLCRRVFEQQGLVVHQRPTPNSPRVGGVAHRSEVALKADFEGIRGPGGRTWVEITAPVAGFISNGYPGGRSNLTLCSDEVVSDSPSQPTGSLCRRLNRELTPKGLIVRARPSRFSRQVGGVVVGQRLYLVEGYQFIRDPDGEPRNWVEIERPVAGFISGDALLACR